MPGLVGFTGGRISPDEARKALRQMQALLSYGEARHRGELFCAAESARHDRTRTSSRGGPSRSVRRVCTFGSMGNSTIARSWCGR